MGKRKKEKERKRKEREAHRRRNFLKGKSTQIQRLQTLKREAFSVFLVAVLYECVSLCSLVHEIVFLIMIYPSSSFVKDLGTRKRREAREDSTAVTFGTFG